MKKMIVTVIGLMMSVSVTAAEFQSKPHYVSAPREARVVDVSPGEGIITPTMAGGVYRTKRITYDANKEILICMEPPGHLGNECRDKDNKYAWKSISQSVPRGRTYVGFKSVSGLNGEHYIEVYWK